MIKYNSNTIKDWYFDTSNIIKAYRNNAVCYYKVTTSGDTPTFDLCYAVVDDISQYQETEFEDVFNKADNKWYKLNNLNQYEEYGVYGSGRTISYYDGKLTVDDGYEYEWNGSSWVNVGEVSGSSKTSDFKIGDIKERVTTSVSDGDYLLFSYYNKSDISKPENIMSYNPSNNYLSNLSGYGITSIDSTTIIDPSIWLLESTASANTFYIKSIKNNLYWGYQSKVSSRSLNLVDSSSSQKAPVLITPSCKENCYGFVEKKSNASTGYGGYGLNQLYGYTYQLNWWNDSSSNAPCTFFSTDGNADFIIYKMNASDAEYPKYYSEKSEPLDNLTFNTMEDALDYAYNNCVYVGLKAAIDGDKYVFSGDSQSGYEWVYNPSKLPIGYTEVEYIENTSTAYINTNFKPNQNTRILLTAQCVTSTPYGRYIGAGSYDKTNAIQFDYETGANGTLHVSWGTVAGWTTYSSCVGDYDVHTYEWDGNVFYRDKGKQNQFSATTAYGTYQCTDNLGIFTSCQNGSGSDSSECFRGKVFDFKMYDNSTLVRDLVPCKRDSDNKYGMYDLVTNTFYLSPNNVNFNGGDLV